jgi:hypothetical protein
MLSKEENERLTRVGPGTPGGRAIQLSAVIPSRATAAAGLAA